MPFLLVTASVDRMVLKKPIRVDTDLKIVGAVTWVGRSSMEIRLEVIQPTPGNLTYLVELQLFFFQNVNNLNGSSVASTSSLIRNQNAN